MTLAEFKSHLRAHPDAHVIISLPDGGIVPQHYHVTEVGHVAKNFVDCGGKFRASESCVLQTWISDHRDDGHRLTAGKLNTILGFADSFLPSDDLPVEVEHEQGMISQFPVEDVTFVDSALTVRLAAKHTACLARERCGKDSEACATTDEEQACCAGSERCC